MARLEYVISGNSTSLTTATKQSVAGLKSVEQAANNANAAIKREVTPINDLKSAIVNLNKTKVNIVDEAALKRQNRLVQELEAELKRAQNIGKVGFSETGDAIEKSNGGLARFGAGLNGALTPIRTLAYILPGLGLAGIFNLAFEGISKVASELEVFNKELTYTQKLQATLNDVSKDTAKQYGEQSTNLRILYTAATDVTNTEKDRLLATKELQKEFPSFFGNLKTEAILNGNSAGAYDEATKSILANARAKAAASKIAELAGKILEQEDKKEKVRIGNINANAASTSLDKKTGIGAALGGVGVRENNKKAKGELAEANKLINEYEAQQKRLVQIAGGNNALAKALSAGQNTNVGSTIKSTSTAEAIKKENERFAQLEDARFVITSIDRNKEKADKILQIERDLQDKIKAINDEAIANIGSKQETETDKIRLEWDKRKKSAEDYFNQLIKLNNASGLDDFDKAKKSLQLQSAQAGSNLLNTNAKNSQVTNKLIEPFSRGIDLGMRKFSTDFYNTLTEVETYTKGTFSSIFADLTGKLTTSLNQVFLNVVVQGLSNALQKAISQSGNGLVNANGGLTTLGKVAGAAAIGGGIISAATPKTSTVGQGLGGALSGAGTGAAIGSIIPGIGTVAGAVVGGVVGLLGGIFGSASARKKEEEQRQAQLEEAKKQTAIQKAQLDAYTSAIVGRVTAAGVISSVEVGAQGQLIANVSGKDIQFVLDRNKKTR